jgi:hypothetical protein
MNLGAAVLHGLDDTAAGAALAAEFVSLHIQLRRSASQQAATAIAELLEAGQLASLTD